MDDKELSGAEEEKEVEKALLKPLLSLEDLVRFSTLEGSGGDSLRTLLQRGQETGAEWPGLEHANIGPYIQKMIAAAAPFKGTYICKKNQYKIYNKILKTRRYKEEKERGRIWVISDLELELFESRVSKGSRDESRKVYYEPGWVFGNR